MRLLERKPDGDLVFRESTDKDVPSYAILSHTWLTNNNEEVSFQDVEAGTGKCVRIETWKPQKRQPQQLLVQEMNSTVASRFMAVTKFDSLQSVPFMTHLQF